MAVRTHPYFPLDLHLPDYVPLQVDFDYILGIFFLAIVVISGSTWKLSGVGWLAGWHANCSSVLCTQPSLLQSPLPQHFAKSNLVQGGTSTCHQQNAC
jgi:hypothetical protein